MLLFGYIQTEVWGNLFNVSNVTEYTIRFNKRLNTVFDMHF